MTYEKRICDFIFKKKERKKIIILFFSDSFEQPVLQLLLPKKPEQMRNLFLADDSRNCWQCCRSGMKIKTSDTSKTSETSKASKTGERRKLKYLLS